VKRLQNHLVGIDQGSVIMFSDFEEDGPMWSGDGDRMRRRRIDFGEPFRNPPAVQVSLTMWDMDQTRNQRADISAEDVSEIGFDLVFRTWGDTRVARVRADWIAFGALRHEDDWDIA